MQNNGTFTGPRSILASKLRNIGLGAMGGKLSKGAYRPNQRDPRDKEMASLQSTSDIYSKKISESLTVGQCREKLANIYLNSFCKIQRAPWDPNDLVDFMDLHTVVTVLKKDIHGKDTKTKEILKGSVDEIFSAKVNGMLPLRILISAPSGRGKTTAVAKMAYDWANRVQGSSLENLPLLFAVKLRNTEQQTSIAEAIRSQLLNGVTDLTQDGLHRFIKENQGICHIVLDGLDEYVGIARNQGLGSNIVDVILWEEYPECRVLVTTRPHLESFFTQGELLRVYAKMWIEGFSRESSREYIDKFFASTSDPSKVEGLKVYLDCKLLINELVITPLFCLIVCHLWSVDLLGSDTTTQTELLDRVNLFLLHRANARSRNKITEKKLHKIICKLGEVALAGLLGDGKKEVFTPYDFRKFPAILDEACELGIISKKSIVTSSFLPANAKENTFTTINFYHKLARDHSAGKSLADQTNKYLLRWKTSKLDRVLREIRENIWEYENLIRFTAGTNNSLCIRIMEAILNNNCLDESERYRILLDCSSETWSGEGSVSSLIQRCVAAQRLVLKSPTVFTVVGMQNLPEQLKRQILEVQFHYSGTSADVTSGLWSCFGSFSKLRSLAISDSSLSFPPSPPEVQSITQLVAKRVTSQSYDGLLSSLPDLEEIDITIDDAEQDIPRITAGLRRTRGQQKTCIILQAPQSLPPERKRVSRGTLRGLGLLIREQNKNIQMLGVSGIVCEDDEDLIYLVQSCRNVKMMSYLVLPGGGSEVGGIIGSRTSDLLSSRESLGVFLLHDLGSFFVEKCQASTETTIKLWSYLKSFTTLIQLTISESSLSFPPSPPKLPSITKLVTNKVPSSSYKGLLSSIPALKEIDITIDDAEQDIPEITDGIRQTGRGQQLTHIAIQAPPSVSSEKKQVSRETMRGLGNLVEKQTKNLKMLCVSGVKCKDEEVLVDLVESCRHVKTMDYLMLPDCGFKRGSTLGSHTNDLPKSQESLRVFVSHEERNHFIEKRQLSPDMILTLWSCLRHLSTLDQLTISDSSLSFTSSPPELPFITKLETKKVTSDSYKGLLSSLPGLKEIDFIIDDAERDITQILAGLRRTGRQQLTDIRFRVPSPLALGKKKVSSKTMRELGLLIRDQTENVEVLGLSGVQCQDEDDLVDLVESCRNIKTMDYLVLLDCGSKRGGRLESKINELLNSQESFRVFLSHEQRDLCIERCQLSTEMTTRLWSFLRSFTSLDEMKISDSSLSFPPSPPEISSVKKLTTVRVTSESFKGLFSSLPGLKEIDITINDAGKDITHITAGLRQTGGEQVTDIRLCAPSSLPSGKKKVSREMMRGLGLVIRDQTESIQVLGLSGVQCQDEDDLVDLVESCRHVKTMDYLVLLDCGSKRGGRLETYISELLNSHESFRVFLSHEQSDLCIEKCQLSTEMTTRLWSFLRSFTSLDELKISDSSLSFPPSPPEISSVKKLTTVRVTPESYKGLLSSLAGLKEIDFTIDNAKRDISQITAGLRRTGGQQLKGIRLRASSSLPSEKKKVSRETMRELGLLIRDQTEKVQVLGLSGVQCQDEDDLVDLVESCRHVRTMDYLELLDCGSKGGGRLESYISGLLKSQESFRVFLSHSDMDPELPTNPSGLDLKRQYPESPSSSSATATDIQPQGHDNLENSTNGDSIIRLDEYSVEVRIPPDEADGLGAVAVEALTTTPPELVLNENEVIISVGLKVSSSKRTFKTPVKVTLPHCAFFTNPEKAELVLYNRNADSDSFVATPCATVGIPRCVVRERDLDLYIGHFSIWWITAIRNKFFRGKYVFFTPYIPEVIHRNGKHFLYLCIKDETTRNQTAIAGHKIAYREMRFFVKWRSGDIVVTYSKDNKEIRIKNIPVHTFRYCTDESHSFHLNTGDVFQSLIRLNLRQRFSVDMEFYIYTDNRLSDALPPATPRPSTEPGTVYMFPGDEEEVTDECLFHVSKNLLPDQFLAVHIALGIKYSIAADIREKNIPLSEKYYDLFQKWKVQSRRTVKVLKEVLAKANAGGLTS